MSDTGYRWANGVRLCRGEGGEAKAIEGTADFNSGNLGASGTLGPRGEIKDGGDMVEVAGMGVTRGELYGMADEAPGGGKRHGGEGSSGNEDGAPSAGKVEAGEAVDLALPVGFFGKGKVGGVGEFLGEGRVPFVGELGEELVAYAVAGEIEGGVSGVFAPGDAAIAEEANDLGALDVDERADDAVGSDGTDGSQPGGSAAAKKAKEDGFRLVGAGVSESDAGRLPVREVVAEERIACVAGGLLEIAVDGGELEIAEGEGEIQSCGEGADKLGVGTGGVAAQIVIDVEDAEGQVPAGEEFEEDVEEADGVGAAGDGNGDAIAGGEHAMALDSMDDSVEQDDLIVGLGTMKQTHGQDD
jgi:hypothetical protein